MLALLTQEKALDVSPEHFHAEFHETGRAACFWVDVCEEMCIRDSTRAIRPGWNGLSDNGAILPSVTGIRCPTSAFLFLL